MVPLKQALLHWLHNKLNEQSFDGLPVDPKDLYEAFSKSAVIKKLRKKGVISKEQHDIILPSTKETHSENFGLKTLMLHLSY